MLVNNLLKVHNAGPPSWPQPPGGYWVSSSENSPEHNSDWCVSLVEGGVYHTGFALATGLQFGSTRMFYFYRAFRSTKWYEVDFINEVITYQGYTHNTGTVVENTSGLAMDDVDTDTVIWSVNSRTIYKANLQTGGYFSYNSIGTGNDQGQWAGDLYDSTTDGNHIFKGLSWYKDGSTKMFMTLFNSNYTQGKCQLFIVNGSTWNVDRSVELLVNIPNVTSNPYQPTINLQVVNRESNGTITLLTVWRIQISSVWTYVLVKFVIGPSDTSVTSNLWRRCFESGNEYPYLHIGCVGDDFIYVTDHSTFGGEEHCRLLRIDAGSGSGNGTLPLCGRRLIG